MAFLQMNFRSEALRQGVTVNIILPENRGKDKFKTLWLLHGLSDDNTTWMRKTSVERYALEYDIAVVMPCVDRSWYTDTANGRNYFTFVTQELPKLMAHYFKGYRSDKEYNLIMGLSMGGYGALKATFTYPEKYGFCASFSGALDIACQNTTFDLNEWRGIFGFELNCAADLKGTKHDLFALAKESKDLPYIYMWCGTEDFFIDVNRKFSAHLSELGINHTFNTSEGIHFWNYWDIHLKNALDYWHENFEKN